MIRTGRSARRRRHVSAALVAAAAMALSARAHADEVRTCVEASEAGQLLRLKGKLTAARERLLACARPGCPDIVKRDCEEWIGEIDDTLPSIVVRAHDPGGADVIAVRVFIDGALAAARLDGKAIALDPGPHKIRYEAEGFVPAAQTVLAVEGEKLRLVDVALVPPASVAPPSPPSSSAPSAPSAEPPAAAEKPGLAAPPPRPFPTTAVVLGGAGVVALGVSAGFALSANARYDELQSTCAPSHTCDPSAVESVHTRALVADVALVAGVATLAAAAYVYFAHKPAPASVGVAPATNGMGASVVGRF